MWSGNDKFYIQFSRLLRLQSFIICFKYCGLMPSKPGEKPAGKQLIASRTFCSLTIKEKSPGLKASGKKVREMVKDFFFNSSETSSLNEANESSEDNNLTAHLISKSATFTFTFLAGDKCFTSLRSGSYLRYFKIRKIFFYMLIQ
jgi:hypothetical protein